MSLIDSVTGKKSGEERLKELKSQQQALSERGAMAISWSEFKSAEEAAPSKKSGIVSWVGGVLGAAGGFTAAYFIDDKMRDERGRRGLHAHGVATLTIGGAYAGSRAADALTTEGEAAKIEAYARYLDGVESELPKAREGGREEITAPATPNTIPRKKTR